MWDWVVFKYISQKTVVNSNEKPILVKLETHLLVELISNDEKYGLLLYEKQCINQPPIILKAENKILTFNPG